MEMISDEAMLEQLASNHAKSYTRKMLNSLDLLKQVHNTKTSPSSNNSASSRSESPNAIPASTSSSGSLLVTAVALSGSTTIEVAK